MKELVGKCGVVTLRGWEEARRAKVGEGCGEEKSAPGIEKGNRFKMLRLPDISRNRPEVTSSRKTRSTMGGS